MLSGIVYLSGTAYFVSSLIPTTRELWHFWELTQLFARLKPFASFLLHSEVLLDCSLFL